MSILELRENSREPITFTLTRAGAAYDLGTKAVRMRRRDGRGTDDVFATTDTPALLVATTPASGILTLTPAAGTWCGVSADWKYFLYFEVEVSSGVWYAWEEATNTDVKIIPAFL
jgi:hypothetical protein